MTDADAHESADTKEPHAASDPASTARPPDDLLDLADDADAAASQLAAANGSVLASAKLSNKKKEALSQVPCKFFRSNGCSAGNACPFAHVTPGEGQGKAICQWFLKGNCRFGHRCALAHILPGQPMSMDRKNKRAAQHQQQTGGGVHAQMMMMQQQQQQQQQQLGGDLITRNPLSRQQPVPSDFLRFSNAGLSGPEAGPSARHFVAGQGAGNGLYAANRASDAVTGNGGDFMFGLPDDLLQQQPSSGLLPGQSENRRPEWQQRIQSHNIVSRSHPDGSGFDGIVGGATAVTTSYGSPARAPAFGTSPFSQPGSHSVFFSGPGSSIEHANADPAAGGAGADGGTIRMATQRPWQAQGRGVGVGDDEHAEDFLPSSLSDLFTPAELERRNRINPASKFKTHLSTAGLTAGSGMTASHSMPARSGADDLFKDGLPWAAREAQWPIPVGGGEATTYSSGSTPPVFGVHVGADDVPSYPRSTAASALGPSRYGASNSSAGFLASRLQGDLARSRDVWGNEVRQDGATTAATGNMADARIDAYSPGVQAAMTHAPGESLPQGLAAGLSRLHLRSDNNVSGNDPARPRFFVATAGADVPAPSSTLQQPLSGGLHAASSGVIGGSRLGHEDLGPVVPSSMFAHRGTPLHLQHHHQGLARSVGHASTSTSLDTGGGNGSASSHGHAGAIGSGSPYTHSPVMRPVEGSIAIPNAASSTGQGAPASIGNNSGAVGYKTGSASLRSINGTTPATTKHHGGQHPGMHRLRTGVSAGTGIGASPLALPATGEEVEEAIFELE